MKIIHFYGYTPDTHGFSDKEWVNSELQHGINYALSRLNKEDGYNCEVHNFTRERKIKVYCTENLKFIR